MKSPRKALLAILSVTLLLGAVVGPAGAGGGKDKSAQSNGKLEMYEATVSGSLVEQITEAGYDVVDIEVLPDEQARITLVLRPNDVQALRKMGVDVELWHSDDGFTSAELAKQQTSAGFKVWRDNDGPDGFERYAHDIADANPDIIELEVIGQTHGTNPGGGPDTPRDVIALQLTKDADGLEGGQKPAVLYNSLQHAREWISGEVNRRLLEWYIKKYRGGDKQVRKLLETTELWFILVTNPDGYQYTFDHERLWRKNLRDNDGDGTVTSMDGVDLNRNFPEHWGWDEDGSSSQPSSETYRGPEPDSEPETDAMINLYDHVDFRFHINYHSVGQWLLYGLGYIMDTPTADDPIFVALSGTDKHPAVQGFNPGLSSSELYVTNGDTNDFAYAQRDSLGWVPELSEGPNGDGFVFPDKEGAIQAEFNRLLPFSVNVARSALDPDDPVSATGIDTKPFYLDVSEIDPQKASNPLSDLTFAHSYGLEQQAQVIAKRDLNDNGVPDEPADAVTLNYSIDGGAPLAATTSPWGGGDRYGGPGQVYYRFLRGTMDLATADIGDSVEVWFTGGGHTSGSFTFEVVEKNPPAGPGHVPVLILSAEDYTGALNIPEYPSAAGPFFLDYYTEALEDNGIDYHVYDVDAMGRTAPSYLGVLNHYDAVIWYTGNDYLTREAGQAPGTGFSTLGFREMLEVREYLNEEGNLLFTGQNAGIQLAQGYPFNPVSTPPFCDGHEPNFNGVDCRFADDDFLQYWLGSYIYNDDSGLDEDGSPFPLKGLEDPFDTTEPTWGLNGPDSADNHESAESFLTTSSLLKPADYPQFTSDAFAEWEDGVSGPFQPHTGSEYVYSDRADISYKRISHPITVPAGGASADFFISYDTEPAWDFLFVEAHNVTDDTWRTLPDANGHTSTSVGDSCPEGWHELHPSLAQYQGADCSGSGSSGAWNATSGRSEGWENWHVDLTAANGFDPGDEVELYISYVSDWAIQGLGVFVDDVTLTPGGTTSFEGEDGGWTIPAGPPPDSSANANDFFRTMDVGYEEGAIVGIDPSDADFRSLHFGFGLEGISTRPEREDVLCRALSYLGGLCTP